jgi:hypothetical protein
MVLTTHLLPALDFEWIGAISQLPLCACMGVSWVYYQLFTHVRLRAYAITLPIRTYYKIRLKPRPLHNSDLHTGVVDGYVLRLDTLSIQHTIHSVYMSNWLPWSCKQSAWHFTSIDPTSMSIEI